MISKYRPTWQVAVIVSYLLNIFLAFGIVLSCIEKTTKKEFINAREPQQIRASDKRANVLIVDSQQIENRLKFMIQQIPFGTTLECKIDGNTVTPCEDGMMIDLPVEGNHTMLVIARLTSGIIAVGDHAFVVGSDDFKNFNGSFAPEPDQNNLALTLVEPKDFINGQALKITEQHRFVFKFAKQPKCNPTLRCSYDDHRQFFWPLCNTNESRIFPSNTMAEGLQYLTVKASCDDIEGPSMQLYWFGVLASYQGELSLKHMTAGNDRKYIFNLQKENDCPDNYKLQFECREYESDSFKPCSNVKASPEKSFRIRAKCNDKVGPEYQLSGI